MERVNFYIDGYNFYFGLKRQTAIDPDWKKFNWLDYVKLCETFTGNNQVLRKVYYFTAPPLSFKQSNRQSMLLRANKLLNGNRCVNATEHRQKIQGGPLNFLWHDTTMDNHSPLVPQRYK